jgi:hypothetical protein
MNTHTHTHTQTVHDEQSFSDKKKFMTSQCLSGLMVWAVDQDTQNYDALHALLGDAAMEDALPHGGELSDEQKEKLSSEFASFTGQNCFVTELCHICLLSLRYNRTFEGDKHLRVLGC